MKATLLARMQTGAATPGGSLAISYKTKHTLPCDPAISLVGTYPHELKAISHKNSVLSSQHLEGSKMSFCRGIKKYTVAHPHSGILFNDKK